MTTKPLGGRRKVPPGWRLVTLYEIKSGDLDACRAGPFGSSISRKYFVEAGVPVIRGNNLSTNLTEFVAEDFAFVSEQRARDKYKNCLVRPGDLVFTCWGTLGQVGRIPEDGPFDKYVISNKQLKLRTDPSMANSRFVYYYVASEAGVEYIKSRAIGSAVPGINLGIMKSIPIALPPMAQQESIVEVLSAYDDLIENNRRRIQLLEQAVRLLYKEWFVYLRFPDHEQVTITDGVPEGWEKKQVKGVLGKVKRPRKIKKSEFLKEGPIPCVDQSRDFIGGYTDDEEAVVDIGQPVIVFGDHTRILKFVDFPFACGADGTQLIVSNDETMSQEFLYFALDAIDLSNYFYARHFKFLKDQYIPRPPNMLLSQFTDNAQPILEQIKSLRGHCHHLSKARDLLLPRLMNGEVAV